MAFCTFMDVYKRVPTDTVEGLLSGTDQDLRDLIEEASNEVATALPSLAEPYPGIVKDITVSLTVCRLYAVKYRDQALPEGVTNEAKAARILLSEIATGKRRLPGLAAQPGAGVFKTNKTGAVRRWPASFLEKM